MHKRMGFAATALAWSVAAIVGCTAPDDNELPPAGLGGESGIAGNSRPGGSGGPGDGGTGGTGGIAGPGGSGGPGGAGGQAVHTSCRGTWDDTPGSFCSWICDESAWIEIPRGPMTDCVPMEAIPDRIPFQPLQWSRIATGREEALLAPVPSAAWAGVISSELGPDGHHAILQFGQSQICGAQQYNLRRFVDLATGATIGVFRTSYPSNGTQCASGTFAPESALTGGVLGVDESNESFMLLGSRRISESSWSWWSEPMSLVEVLRIHDLADGTLVLRTGARIRAALSRDSNALTQIAEQSVAGTAGDDVFVWSELLTPSGSRVRTWSRDEGVRDVVHLPDDTCLVAATESHVLGMSGVGNCLSALQDLRFWRVARGALGGPAGVSDGPAVESSVRLAIKRLLAHRDHAAVLIAEDSDDVNRLFYLVWRFSDQTLWRINHRPGMALYGATMAFTEDHLYFIEYDENDTLPVMPSVQRLALDELEAVAVPF